VTWTAERWARIEQVFHAAAQAGVSSRRVLLERECAGDHDLRDAVERLLAADEPVGDDWLERGIVGAMAGDDPLLGSCVGAFELVERVADGGMGTVYRARRVGADFDQEVAVKLLRLGLSTPAMRERFARERQTQARLVHPNVARLLDGGTTAEGVPFFAMEFVDGEPLDRFADRHRLSLPERLRLFVQVCKAVQFAHQNLVVHLDLKPSNILVDAGGTPKLLDFGVAGLLSDIAGGGEIAATRSRPLTPEYASPEQLRGDPVSTAADVWALGVVLYELLTGRRPFVMQRGDLALARTVIETEPSRPSTTYGERDDPTPTAAVRAASRAADARELQRLLRGDLDRIVAMAMHKEPAGRYPSCAALAEDIERWLGGFPVRAAETSMARRFGKFVRRNKLVVGSGIAVAVSLLGGIAASLHLAATARAERDAAGVAQRRAEHDATHARIEATSNHLVAEFLGETFLSADLVGVPAERERVLATIQRRAEQVRRQHAGNDHLRANLLHALGRACAAVEAFAPAEALLREAAGIRAAGFGEESLEYALSLGSLGQLHWRQGRLADAAEALRAAYRLHVECEPDVHSDIPQAANDLAAVERALGNVDRARELHRQALAQRRVDGDPVLVAESLNNLANSEPDLVAARALLEEAWSLRRAVLGDEDPLTVQSQSNLGTLCLRAGELGLAQEHLQAAVERGRRLGALGSDGLAVSLRTLAYVRLLAEDFAAAITAVDEALAIDEARFGRDHARVAGCLEVRGAIEERQGRWPEMLAAWREVVRIREATLPAGHRQILLGRTSLGNALVRNGTGAEAVALLEPTLGALRGLGDAANADVVDAQLGLGLARERTGDVAGAERDLLAALAAATGPAASRQAPVRAHLRAFYLRHGRADDAARHLPPAGSGR
jgi:serine/threonine protein kinase/tetratricopeptide (TPR) repeat protein